MLIISIILLEQELDIYKCNCEFCSKMKFKIVLLFVRLDHLFCARLFLFDRQTILLFFNRLFLIDIPK